MKMLMIVCPEARQKEIRELITRLNVTSYSEIPNVLGAGKTGKHFDTHVFPGKSVLVFTVIPTTKKKEIVAELKAYQTTLMPGEGLRVFTLNVESTF